MKKVFCCILILLHTENIYLEIVAYMLLQSKPSIINLALFFKRVSTKNVYLFYPDQDGFSENPFFATEPPNARAGLNSLYHSPWEIFSFYFFLFYIFFLGYLLEVSCLGIIHFAN